MSLTSSNALNYLRSISAGDLFFGKCLADSILKYKFYREREENILILIFKTNGGSYSRLRGGILFSCVSSLVDGDFIKWVGVCVSAAFWPLARE